MEINDKIIQIINEIEKEGNTDQIKDVGSYRAGVVDGLEWALELIQQETAKTIKGEIA